MKKERRVDSIDSVADDLLGRSRLKSVTVQGSITPYNRSAVGPREAPAHLPSLYNYGTIISAVIGRGFNRDYYVHSSTELVRGLERDNRFGVLDALLLLDVQERASHLEGVLSHTVEVSYIAGGERVNMRPEDELSTYRPRTIVHGVLVPAPVRANNLQPA